MVRIPPPEKFGGIKTAQAETDRRVGDLERVDGSQFGRILIKVKQIFADILDLTEGLADQVAGYISEFSRTREEIDTKNGEQDTAIAGKMPLFSVLSPGNGGTGTSNVHNTTGTGVQLQVYVQPDGTLTKGASTARLKADIRSVVIDLAKILVMEPRQFLWRSDVHSMQDAHSLQALADDGGYADPAPQVALIPVDYGLIAEEAHEAGLTWLVRYGDDGLPEGIRYERLPIALLDVARDHDARIGSLETQTLGMTALIASLQADIADLTAQLGQKG